MRQKKKEICVMCYWYSAQKRSGLKYIADQIKFNGIYNISTLLQVYFEKTSGNSILNAQ